MKHTYDNDLGHARKVIDCVVLVEDHTEIRCEMRTRGTGEWKLLRLGKLGFNFREEATR
jgi:hypothetical protein